MDQFLRKQFTADRGMRIIFSAAIIAAIVFCVFSLWEVLLPFLMAGIFAYVMMPFVRFFQNTLRIRHRGLSVLLVLLLVVALVTLGFLYLIPAINDEVQKTLEALSQYTQGKSILNIVVPEGYQQMLQSNLNLDELTSHLSVDNIVAASKAMWGRWEALLIVLFRFSLGVLCSQWVSCISYLLW